MTKVIAAVDNSAAAGTVLATGAALTIGMVAAFVYWELRVSQGWPTPLALVVTLFVIAPMPLLSEVFDLVEDYDADDGTFDLGIESTGVRAGMITSLLLDTGTPQDAGIVGGAVPSPIVAAVSFRISSPVFGCPTNANVTDAPSRVASA